MQLSPTSIEDFRVPVQRTEVEVVTQLGERKAVLFVAPGSTPQDLFEQEATFFPAEEDGAVRLYAREAVMVIAVTVDQTEVEPLSVLGIPFDKRAVVVHLRNGARVSGVVRTVGRTRTLDVLNQASKSFSVHSDGKIHHVAKAFVDNIVEVR